MGETCGHKGGEGNGGSHAEAHAKGHAEGKGGWFGSSGVFYALVIIAFAVLAFNQLQLGALKASAASVALSLSSQQGAVGQGVAAAGTAGAGVSVAGAGASVPQDSLQATPSAATQGSAVNLEAIAQKIIPTGVPPVYGAELGVSFSDPVPSMAKLAALDDGEGMADPAQNARYVKIGKAIACEYCCGADTLVFDTGKAACGCAHSYAMRGIAKYLISKHGPELSDERILEEVSKWKVMFFPKPMLTKAVQFAAAKKDLNYVDLASNKFRGFTAPAASGGLDSVPSQVGGC